jgi:hypothetical protein
MKSRTRAEGESASITLNFPGQAPRVEATFNAPTGPPGYAGPAPTGPAQQSWAHEMLTASGPTPFCATNVQWTQYPQYPAQAPVVYAQGYWAAGQGFRTSNSWKRAAVQPTVSGGRRMRRRRPTRRRRTSRVSSSLLVRSASASVKSSTIWFACEPTHESLSTLQDEGLQGCERRKGSQGAQVCQDPGNVPRFYAWDDAEPDGGHDVCQHGRLCQGLGPR